MFIDLVCDGLLKMATCRNVLVVEGDNKALVRSLFGYQIPQWSSVLPDEPLFCCFNLVKGSWYHWLLQKINISCGLAIDKLSGYDLGKCL